MSPQPELSDRDLCLVRLRLLDLAKSFFQEQPDGELIGRWRGLFTALGNDSISDGLARAVRQLSASLDQRSLEEIKNEYDALFFNPYSKNRLCLNGSYYLDGKSYGPSLVDYRQLLKESQVIKNPEVAEPEDSLSVMLDTLATMVDEERQGNEQIRSYQDRLLMDFLVPTVARLGESARKNEQADFYEQCIDFVESYLELEQALVVEEQK